MKTTLDIQNMGGGYGTADGKGLTSDYDDLAYGFARKNKERSACCPWWNIFYNWISIHSDQ